VPVALHFAAQRRVLPEVMFGRGIGGVSYTTSAEVRCRRALVELFADLIKDTVGGPNLSEQKKNKCCDLSVL
jgi:hypothetical protein